MKKTIKFDKKDKRSYCPECRRFDCRKRDRCGYYYEANPNNPKYKEE